MAKPLHLILIKLSLFTVSVSNEQVILPTKLFNLLHAFHDVTIYSDQILELVKYEDIDNNLGIRNLRILPLSNTVRETNAQTNNTLCQSAIKSINQHTSTVFIQLNISDSLNSSNNPESEFFLIFTQVCKLMKKCAHVNSPGVHNNFTRNTFWNPVIIFILNPDSKSLNFASEFKKFIGQADLGCFSLESQVYLLVSELVEIKNKNANNNSGPVLESHKIYEIYSIKTLNIFQEVEHGCVRNFNGQLDWSHILNARLQRRMNFNQIPIRALGVQNHGYFQSVFFKEVNGTLKFDGGFDGNYIQILANTLNASVLAVRGTDYISKDENGEVTGMGQQLLQGQADISVTHSEYLVHRQRQLSYLQPHYVGRIIAFFKQPSSNFGRDIYIQPLKMNVRITVLAIWILIISCLYVVSLIRKKLVPETEELDFDFVMCTIASICQQGWFHQPNNFPTKLIILISLFFGLTLHIGFSATIVSQLSIDVLPIKSFDDIIRKTNMKIYMERYTYQPHEFVEKGKRDGSIQNEIEKSLKLHFAFDVISNSSSTYIAMQDEFYRSVFIYNSSMSSRTVCGIVSEANLYPGGIPMIAKAGMVLRKDSPFKEFFKYKQIKLKESGIQLRLQKDLLEARPTCNSHRRNKIPVAIGLQDMFTPWLILILGHLTSFVVLLIEILYDRSFRPLKYSL